MSRAARLVPRSRWGVVLAVLWALLLLFPVLSADLFFQNMIILSLIFAIGASGLNIISGYGGYVSLGQSAFLGLGAYTVGLLAVRVDVSPFVFVPLAGVVGAAFAALLGVIAMRTRGHSFVILTIAFLLLMQLVLLNWPSFTKGSSGLSLPLAIWDPAYQNWPFYYALVALLALAVLLSWRIRRTKLGMGLVAMREDEDKAATVGISTPTYKILGFVASAVVLSMAGGVYAYYLNFIDPRGMFDIVISVQIILSVLLGGRGTLWGPVLGAFIIEPLNEFANQSLGGGNSRLLIFGGLMALVVLFMPQGIVPAA
jgi:branched-chain amino acid transport system permease protein